MAIFGIALAALASIYDFTLAVHRMAVVVCYDTNEHSWCENFADVRGLARAVACIAAAVIVAWLWSERRRLRLLVEQYRPTDASGIAAEDSEGRNAVRIRAAATRRRCLEEARRRGVVVDDDEDDAFGAQPTADFTPAPFRNDSDTTRADYGEASVFRQEKSIAVDASLARYDLIIGSDSIAELCERGWVVKAPTGHPQVRALIDHHVATSASQFVGREKAYTGARDDMDKSHGEGARVMKDAATSTTATAFANTLPLAARCVATAVAVMGGENRGKTTLLNGLFGQDLPADALVHTEGISLKWLDGERERDTLVVIDTAGARSPVMANSERELVDRRATEAFIEGAVFDMASQIILVVGDLNTDDQSYCSVLTQMMKKLGRTTLFIVHNFRDAHSEAQLWGKWQEQVLRNYGACGRKVTFDISAGSGRHPYASTDDVDDRHHTDYYPYFLSTINDVQVRHLYLARQGSAAGRIWNKRTFGVLNSMLQTLASPQPFDPLERLSHYTALALPTFADGRVDLVWNPPRVDHNDAARDGSASVCSVEHPAGAVAAGGDGNGDQNSASRHYGSCVEGATDVVCSGDVGNIQNDSAADKGWSTPISSPAHPIHGSDDSSDSEDECEEPALAQRRGADDAACVFSNRWPLMPSGRIMFSGVGFHSHIASASADARVTVLDKSDHLAVRVEIPGIVPDDLDVTMHSAGKDHYVQVQATRRADPDHDERIIVTGETVWPTPQPRLFGQIRINVNIPPGATLDTDSVVLALGVLEFIVRKQTEPLRARVRVAWPVTDLLGNSDGSQ